MAALQGRERELVRLGEVEDMDVIADAGAVRRLVVVAVDHEFLALAADRLQDDRIRWLSERWSSPYFSDAPAALK